ncbi:MAG TPA: DUF504 domain-containing protein [Zeimonas sp.]|nr:DUF504 domain-containing protein [Zeimonas sp.]
MVPLHELLARIRWDPEFGKGEFALGYLDRVLGRIVVVPLRDVVVDPHDHFAFELLDDEGIVHHVPFHRVRQVLHDGAVIWERPDSAR